jgi:hypothetical protein
LADKLGGDMRTDLLRTLATNFGSHSVRSAKAIREMYSLDPIGFPPAVAEVLRSGPELPGAQFLVSILASKPDWLRSVCDPEKYTLDESLEWVRRARKLDPHTELKLAEMLARSGFSTDAEARFVSRVFAVLKQSPRSAALPALRQLSKSPNARVRSKAVLLIGHLYQNPTFAGAESDSRVSANAVESLWGLATPAARGAFLKAAVDENHRIAANGIIGLYLMGDECGIPFLFHLSKSETALCRAAAAWAMGHLEDPRFLPRLAGLIEDSDSMTRQRALRSNALIRQKTIQMRAAGALTVQIQEYRRHDEVHTVRFTVGREDQSISGLDQRRFVVWNGTDLVEEFSWSLQEGPCFEIEYQAPPSPTRQIKVEVYAASGVGEDTGVEMTRA